MSIYTKFFRHCLPLCLAFPLILLNTGCAEVVVKQINYAAPIDMPDDAHPRPILFTKLRTLLPPGTEVGLESGAGPALLGGICSWRNYPVGRRVLSHNFEKQYLEMAFENALESQGYDVTNSIDIDHQFEYRDELARAEYGISAKVKDIDLDLCHRGLSNPLNIFNTNNGDKKATKGKLYANIEWSVYSYLKRKTVLKVTTEGYSKRHYPNTEGLELLFMDAFEMAAHNLGTDRDFYNLLVEGIPPKRIDKRIFDRKATKRPRIFNPQERVIIQNPPLSKAPFAQTAQENRHNALTIGKRGHGSGFFITKQGHILTNAHVVGDSQLTRVILADKKQAITAEVLRIDKPRDVALLKLTKLPENYEIKTLPLQTTWPQVGTKAYVIGSPIDRDLFENTITSGIISNHRYNYKIHGLRLNFIQSDATIHGGNSGGPLLDKNGNITGIATLTYKAEDHSTGLNFFVPIGEAIKALDIELN